MAYQGRNPRWNTSTHTPQSADPSNPVEGMVFYADGTSRGEGLWVYRNGVWTRIGSGSGVRNFAQDYESCDSTIGWTTGNSATFDDTGTITGTFATETTAPLFGGISLKVTSPATNDWVSLRDIPIDLGARGKLLAGTLEYSWDGDDDALLKVLDGDGVELDGDIAFIENTTGDSEKSRKVKVVWVQPSTGTASETVTIGVHFANDPGSSKTLIFDSVVVTDAALEIVEDTGSEYYIENGENLENVFGARVSNNGSAAITSQGPKNFISSVNRTAAGVVEVTFIGGFFSVIPAVVATAETTSDTDRQDAHIFDLTTSGCTVVISNASTNVDKDFNLEVARQGADVISGRAVAAIAGRTHEDDSEVFVQNFSSFAGSGANSIFRFSIVNNIIGNEITYDSVAGTYTVNSPGVYHMSGSSGVGAAGLSIAIIRNSTSFDYTSSNLAYMEGSNNVDQINVSTSKFLETGDVIRFMQNASTAPSAADRVRFKITKIGTQPLLGSVESRSETIDVTGSGNFTAGSIKVTLQNTQVIISSEGALTHASLTTPASAAGLIPAWALPAAGDKRNLFAADGSVIGMVTISTTGVLTITYRNYSGTLTAQTTTGGTFTIPYNI